MVSRESPNPWSISWTPSLKLKLPGPPASRRDKTEYFPILIFLAWKQLLPGRWNRTVPAWSNGRAGKASQRSPSPSPLVRAWNFHCSVSILQWRLVSFTGLMIATLQGVAETSRLFLNISIAFLGTLLSACSCCWNASEGGACHLQSEVILMKMDFRAPFPLQQMQWSTS